MARLSLLYIVIGTGCWEFAFLFFFHIYAGWLEQVSLHRHNAALLSLLLSFVLRVFLYARFTHISWQLWKGMNSQIHIVFFSSAYLYMIRHYYDERRAQRHSHTNTVHMCYIQPNIAIFPPLSCFSFSFSDRNKKQCHKKVASHTHIYIHINICDCYAICHHAKSPFDTTISYQRIWYRLPFVIRRWPLNGC